MAMLREDDGQPTPACFYSVAEINERFVSLGAVEPTVALQWANVLTLLNYADRAWWARLMRTRTSHHRRLVSPRCVSRQNSLPRGRPVSDVAFGLVLRRKVDFFVRVSECFYAGRLFLFRRTWGWGGCEDGGRVERTENANAKFRRLFCCVFCVDLTFSVFRRHKSVFFMRQTWLVRPGASLSRQIVCSPKWTMGSGVDFRRLRLSPCQNCFMYTHCSFLFHVNLSS